MRQSCITDKESKALTATVGAIAFMGVGLAIYHPSSTTELEQVAITEIECKKRIGGIRATLYYESCSLTLEDGLKISWRPRHMQGPKREELEEGSQFSIRYKEYITGKFELAGYKKIK